MKKIDVDAVEKFAKEKNIDKNKIEEIAESYQGKSQDELMDELINIGKTLQGKEEFIDKFKSFLDENQRKKVDAIMSKISEAEAQDKINSKKSKKSKSAPLKDNSSNKKSYKSSNNKNTKNNQPSNQDNSNESSKPTKKFKKISKKTKNNTNE